MWCSDAGALLRHLLLLTNIRENAQQSCGTYTIATTPLVLDASRIVLVWLVSYWRISAQTRPH